ncbi:MAG: hypothetical protein A2622_02095 [Bdellovibrionales bacterium RIFCSPHIGHO2_01_FULL_40_29]|nr:MAG: hypothetical protein A2622_02095 [Bdellovibrionales bacterium RIFCSPHIGHO2_01_FULL_40_29]OFZ33879.1 MAG: hypothetical protein A3D17_02515 [Bdellovibrionales bacterium RIFCSPHIGHO2_02_FULL_40_15]
MNRKNILVIDDNKNDLLMAKFVIMRMGYNPILIDSPRKIVETLQTQDISLIILDYDMPEMTGLDVLKRIRKVESFRVIPVVMLTGNSSPAHVKNTVSMGAIDYIVKPIDPIIFETKVQNILKQDIQKEKENWIEFEVQKTQSAEVRIFNYCQILSIGEVSLTFKTNQRFPIGFTFFSDSRIFAELEIKNPALKVERVTKSGDDYMVQCAMLGLSEIELKKIRLYQKLLVKSKSA